MTLPPESPLLHAELSGASLLHSWRAAAQNFTLQATTNLAEPAAWTTLTNLPVIVNEQYTVTDSVVGAPRLYRLKQ